MKVSTHLIEQTAQLPHDVVVWYMTTSPEDIRNGQVEVTLRCEQFADVPEGEAPPLIEPIVHQLPARREWQFGKVRLWGRET